MNNLPEEISIERKYIENTLAVMKGALNRKDKTYCVERVFIRNRNQDKMTKYW